jgi:hypothetical protein
MFSLSGPETLVLPRQQGPRTAVLSPSHRLADIARNPPIPHVCQRQETQIVVPVDVGPIEFVKIHLTR